jgi:hypothetical protein
MNIKFEKDGVIKETHIKFTDDLIAVGWKVVEEKPKTVKKKKESE